MVHILVWLYAFWEYFDGTQIVWLYAFWEYLNGTHISLAVGFLGIFEWYTDCLAVCLLMECLNSTLIILIVC